jgi:hypothetical protein
MGLHVGIIIDKDSENEISNCIYAGCDKGIAAWGYNIKTRNHLFYYTNNGIYVNSTTTDKTHEFYNLTCDKATGGNGIYLYAWSQDTIKIYDTLFSNLNYGIKYDSPAGTLNPDYCRFFNVTTKVSGSSSIGAHSVELTNTPYNTTTASWSDRWFLDQSKTGTNGCVNAGSRDAYTGCMSKHTTNYSNKYTDTGNLDIGYHYFIFTDATDTDEMNDHWEAPGANNAGDPDDDPDLDMLTNLEEYENGTNPHDHDTDGDGLVDGWEVHYGLNVFEDDGSDDPDEDNWTNLQEQAANTNPFNADTNANQIPDPSDPDPNGDALSLLGFYPPIGQVTPTAVSDPHIWVYGVTDKDLLRTRVCVNYEEEARVPAKVSFNSFKVDVPLDTGLNELRATIWDCSGIETVDHKIATRKALVLYEPDVTVTWENIVPKDYSIFDNRPTSASGHVSVEANQQSGKQVEILGVEIYLNNVIILCDDPPSNPVTNMDFSTAGTQPQLVNGVNFWTFAAIIKITKDGNSFETRYLHEPITVFYHKTILSNDTDWCTPEGSWGPSDHYRIRQQRFNTGWYSSSPFSNWTDSGKHIRKKDFMLFEPEDLENDIPPELAGEWTYTDSTYMPLSDNFYSSTDFDCRLYDSSWNLLERNYFLGNTSLIFKTQPVPYEISNPEYIIRISNLEFAPPYEWWAWYAPDPKIYSIQGYPIKSIGINRYVRASGINSNHDYPLTSASPSLYYIDVWPPNGIEEELGTYFCFNLDSVEVFYVYINDIYYQETAIKNSLPAGAAAQLSAKISPPLGEGEHLEWQLITPNAPATLSSDGYLAVKPANDQLWASQNIWTIEIKAAYKWPTSVNCAEVISDTKTITLSKNAIQVFAFIDKDLWIGEEAPVYAVLYDSTNGLVLSAERYSIAWQSEDDPTGQNPPSDDPDEAPEIPSSLFGIRHCLSYPDVSWLYTGAIETEHIGLAWVRAVIHDSQTSNNYASPWQLVSISGVDIDIAGADDSDQGFAGVNDDDDNRSATSDLSENSVSGEDNLVEIILRKPLNVEYAPEMTLTISQGSTRIKVWRQATKGTQITFNGTDNKFSFSALPISLYVEGIGVSSALWDSVLTFTSSDSRGGSDEVKFTVIDADITKPAGSLDAASNPSASWLTPSSSSCYHFDFQGVTSDSPGKYDLNIEGQILPSDIGLAFDWTLDPAVGTLTNITTATPTHAAPANLGEGILTLRIKYNGNLTGVKDEKKVKIYQDHLDRDHATFPLGNDCGQKSTPDLHPWSFRNFNVNINMPWRWNCHGSTNHACEGSGIGSSGDVSETIKGWEHTRYEHPINWNNVVAELDRGDVIAFYDGLFIQHSHTCIGGSSMFGANNEAISGEETWIWDECTSEDWWNTAGFNNPPLPDCTHLIIYNRPE